MSETSKAVDRLRWLCAEAVVRVREETHPDFTFGLEPILDEVCKIAEWIRSDQSTFQGISGTPFTLTKRDYSSVKLMEGKKVWGFKDCCLFDPHTSHSVQFRVWEDTEGFLGEMNSYEIQRDYYPAPEPLFMRSDPGPPTREFLLRTTCLYFERWVRFLTDAAEKLQSSSTAAAALLQMEPPNQTEAEKQTLAKGRKSPRKNGRPPRANLAPKQLEQIHRRVLDGQSLSSIFRSYEVGFSYDTFRRLYYIWQDKQGEGRRSKEQNRR